MIRHRPNSRENGSHTHGDPSAGREPKDGAGHASGGARRETNRKRLARLDLTGTGTCASFNFRRATRAVTRLYDAAFERFGIRSTQFTILIAIAKAEPVPMSPIADTLMLDATTLTRSLRLLQRQRLVAISNRATKRQRFLTLTPAGERMLARTLPVWRAAHARFVATVGEAQWSKLRGQLEQLAHSAAGLETSAST